MQTRGYKAHKMIEEPKDRIVQESLLPTQEELRDINHFRQFGGSEFEDPYYFAGSEMLMVLFLFNSERIYFKPRQLFHFFFGSEIAK